MRTYKPRSRASLIEQKNQRSLTHLLKSNEVSIHKKRELVKERNPYLFIFGENLVVQGGRSYEEYINNLYQGA